MEQISDDEVRAMGPLELDDKMMNIVYELADLHEVRENLDNEQR